VVHTTLKLLSSSFSVAVVAVLPGPHANAQQAAAPQQSLAAQVRIQGFTCANPLRATRDRKRFRPDRASWVLECSNATYGILLDPDMAAAVTVPVIGCGRLARRADWPIRHQVTGMDNEDSEEPRKAVARSNLLS
jgi:hypothetical protein